MAQSVGVSLMVLVLLRKKRGVSPGVVMRLGRLRKNGPVIRLRMQQAFDLLKLLKRRNFKKFKC